MKRIVYLFVAVVIFVSFSCSQKPVVQEKLTFLHTSGQFIVNEKNDTVFLKGVGLGNWLLPEGYMWHFGENGDRPRKIEKIVEDLTSPEFSAEFWKAFRKNFLTEKDVIKMHELGFNSVRPALNARVFLTEGDTAEFIEENFSLLDSLIYWCGKHNIYVILDMHGAPGGQTGENIDDSPNNLPELFMNPIYEDRLTRLWVKLADRYKDSPAVAGFDLLNEPLPERSGAAGKYKHLILDMYKRITAEIRKVDTKHMIILEGVNWANDWSVFTENIDDNLVYQFHYYCWNNPDNLNDISYYLKRREELNCPVWVGETGERNPNIYYATTQYFEKNNIGWAYWTWKKINTRQVVYSVNAPSDYEKIIEFSQTGEKPSVELAERVFNELLENIKVENCELQKPVTEALFRRIPSKIFAVNYNPDGPGISYKVNDTIKSDFYRKNEGVKVVLIPGNEKRYRGSEQAIKLSSGEWTKYSVTAPEKFVASVNLKLRANNENTAFVFSVNEKSMEFSVSDTAWNEISIEDQQFIKGKNLIKLEVGRGQLEVLYFDIQNTKP